MCTDLEKFHFKVATGKTIDSHGYVMNAYLLSNYGLTQIKTEKFLFSKLPNHGYRFIESLK